MQTKLVLFFLVGLFIQQAHAQTSEFQCRYNTIEGKPVISIYGKWDNGAWEKLTKNKDNSFKSHAKRDEAEQICLDHIDDFQVKRITRYRSLGIIAISEKGYGVIPGEYFSTSINDTMENAALQILTKVYEELKKNK